MRNLILFNLQSLDGFFEGPGHDTSWHNVDDEFNEYVWENIKGVDTILFGRVTYELMASFWPSAEALRDDPVTADLMNTWPKAVFSHTLKKADWSNTRLFTCEAVDEVRRLKEIPGKDLIVFGSANLAASLTRAGLIDEYRLMVNPVILGKGTPLFQGFDKPVTVNLVQSREFRNGNVLLILRKIG